MYHINRVIKETGADFMDGSHIIYVNGSYKNDSEPIGKLMHDFRCTNSVDMFYPQLAKQLRYFKETEGGRKIMCKAFEDLAEKRILEEKKATAQRMIVDGKLSAEEIARYTGLPIDIVEELVNLQLP